MTRLLVVEDSYTQAKELSILLEAEGFQVDVARDGARGLEQAKSTRYDVVLSDVVMPGMDGFEMCRQLKADPSTHDVPVVLVTSLTDPLDIIRGLECGADNFITKPYESSYLVSRIRSLLENRGLRAGRKVAVGVELMLLGRRFTITSAREQMLDLLISTFEEVLRSRQREYEAKLAEEAARQSKRHLSLLLEVSELLGPMRDREASLRALAELLVRRMADGCVIRSVDGEAELTVAACSDKAKVPLAERLATLGPPGAPEGLRAFVDEGRVAFAERIAPEDVDAFAQDPAHREALHALGPKSALLIPLRGRDRALGVVWIYTAEARPYYDRRDFELAEDLGRRAALALDNAHLYREAQDAIKVRDDFMSVASHELKTPLTALTLNVQGLLRAHQTKREDISEALVGRLQALDRQADRIRSLIGALLDVAHIAAGAMPIDLQTVDLRVVIGDAVNAAADAAKRANSSIRYSADEAIVGRWDPQRVGQVAENLLSNAVKFGAGSPIDVRLTATADVARLVVRDYGIGIDQPQLARIFGRFERAVSTRHYGGFGLGLWISRQAVEAMGGTIDVTSEPGKGSTFTVALPRRA